MLHGGPHEIFRFGPDDRAAISDEAAEAASSVGPWPDVHVKEIITFLVFSAYRSTFIHSKIESILAQKNLDLLDILSIIRNGRFVETKSSKTKSDVFKYTLVGKSVDSDIEYCLEIIPPKRLDIQRSGDVAILSPQTSSFLISDLIKK